jgi:DNA-binding transcriptional LysR family regulator
MQPVFVQDRLDELALFVELVDAGSLSAAARRLGLPKSTVARAVSRFEKTLGAAVVRRGARGFVVTEEGQRLAAQARPHLMGLRDAAAALGREEPAGVVRLTAPPDLGHRLLAPLVASFVASNPRVRVEVNLTLALVDVAEGDCDLALRVAARDPLADSSLVARKLGELTFDLYAGARMTEVPRSIEALERTPHVLLDERARTVRIQLQRGRLTHGYVARGPIATNDIGFALESLSHGACIGLLPSFLARPAVAAGSLRRVLPGWSVRGSKVWLLYRPQRPLPRKVSALRDHLLREAPARLARDLAGV